MSIITRQITLYDQAPAEILRAIHTTLMQMRGGGILMVSANNPSAIKDICHLCASTGNEILRFLDGQAGYLFLIRRQPAQSSAA